MKCPECGAEASGQFCAYCGAEQQRQDENTTGADNDNMLGFDLKKIGDSLGNALKMQAEYNRTGAISQEMLAGLSSGFGLDSVIAGVNAKNKELDQKIAEGTAKFKKARADIAKGICPECGKPFKKKQDFCKSCGASVMIESYDDN